MATVGPFTRLPRPPKEDNKTQWAIWYDQVYKILSGLPGIEWRIVSKAGSDLIDIETRNHNDLQNINGTGTYHVSSTEGSELTSLDNLTTGVVCKTADATYSARTITGTAPVTVDNGDGVSGNPVIYLTVPRGECYCNDAAIAVSLTGNHTYVQIASGLTDGGTSGMTFQNGSELKCVTAGVYVIKWSLSISHSVSDTTIEGGILINGNAIQNGANATRAKENGVVYSVSGCALQTLAVDDVVSLGCERDAGVGTTTITVDHANLVAYRIV